MKKILLLYALIAGFFISCNDGPSALEDILLGSIDIKLNPYERSPLSALLELNTKENCSIEFVIDGKIPVTQEFSAYKRFHSIPVLGLYPDTINILELIITTRNDKIYTGKVQIQTSALPDFFPDIEIETLNRDKMEPGFHLIELLIANNGKFKPYTVIFDDYGDVRWYMDMSELGQICYTPLRLKNGNWLYLSWIDLLEVNDLGKLIKHEKLWGHAGDHHLIELPNNQILMGGSAKDSKVIRDGREIPTRFDHVVLWDRPSNRTAKAWDLREVLDVDRSVYPPDYTLDFESDWFHINSFDQSISDNSLIISGRNQGVLKVDQNNSLKWILAPHKDWGKAGYSGQGIHTSEYLLTAIDPSGKAYNKEIQNGTQGDENFEWSTGQHAVKLLENGNILLFDNGLMRNFQKKATYSRAVEYKIDEKNMTIQQVWQYGKERGRELHSGITSDVDVLSQTGNRLITAGNVRLSDSAPRAKMVEVTYPDNEVVFEANINFKDALGSKEQSWAQFDVVYRGERYFLVDPSEIIP